MAEKSDAGQTGSAAAAASKGRIAHGCCAFPVHSHLAFVLQVYCARVLEGGNSLVSSAASGVMVSSDRGPLVVVLNVTGTEGLHID